MGNLRLLMAAAIIMAVLIVAGTAVLIVTIVRRSSAPAGIFAIQLAEPGGTRIVSVGVAGDRMVVQLQGGGPDRVVVVDPHSGTITGRVTLEGK